MLRSSLLCATLVVALCAVVPAQTYIGCPDLNAAASASNNTWPMGADTEWRFQYMLPASCFPATEPTPPA